MTSKAIPHISEAEWEVMKVLWNNPGATANQVVTTLKKSYSWTDGTIRTYLRRLVKKTAVRYEIDSQDNRIYYYYPTVDESDAVAHESKSFFRRVFNGEAGIALSSFIKDAELSSDDIQELENIIRQKKE